MTIACRLPAGLTVPDHIKRFSRINSRVWEDYLDSSTDGTLIIDALIDHPGHLMTNGVAGNYLCEENEWSPAFLRRGPQRRNIARVCQSYGVDDKPSLAGLLARYGSPTKTLRAAKQLFDDVSSIEDLLEVRYKEIQIGDLVYNKYLRSSGLGTFDGRWGPIFKQLARAIGYANAYEGLISSRDVRAVLLADIFYVPAGVLARIASREGLTVFSRKLGVKAFTLRRYNPGDSLRANELRPPDALFEHLWNNHRELATSEGESYLRQRMSGVIGEDESQVAFDGDTNQTNDLAKYRTDTERPFAVVMIHVFNDAPHSHEGMIFTDYEAWLRETIQQAVSQRDVDWGIKPHPAEERYEPQYFSESVVEDELSSVDNHNIRLLPRDVNTQTVLECADVFVTVRGTVGLEATGIGVPVITAGRNRYSDFGFTHTATNLSEYRDLLSKARDLSPLTDQEVDRSRTFSYIQNVLFPVPTCFVPEMKRHGGVEAAVAWEQATELAETHDPGDDPLREKIRTFCRGSFTQLFNYDQIGVETASDLEQAQV